MLAKSAGKHSEFFWPVGQRFSSGIFWTIFRATPSIFFCLNFVQGVFITQYKLWGGEKLGDNFVFWSFRSTTFFTYFQEKAQKISLIFAKIWFSKKFLLRNIFHIFFYVWKITAQHNFLILFQRSQTFFFKFVNTPGLFSCFCLHCSAVCLRSTSSFLLFLLAKNSYHSFLKITFFVIILRMKA